MGRGTAGTAQHPPEGDIRPLPWADNTTFVLRLYSHWGGKGIYLDKSPRSLKIYIKTDKQDQRHKLSVKTVITKFNNVGSWILDIKIIREDFHRPQLFSYIHISPYLIIVDKFASILKITDSLK